jgi:hypothetical protein
MAKREWRDSAKERCWRRLFRLWRRSGLTGRDFCAKHGLSEPSFYAWRREIGRRDQEAASRPKAKRACVHAKHGGSGPAFVQMRIDGAASARAAVEVVVANGRILRVGPGFDADVLRQVLRLLEEPLC